MAAGGGAGEVRHSARVGDLRHSVAEAVAVADVATEDTDAEQLEVQSSRIIGTKSAPGFSRLNHTRGVADVLATAFVLGRWPQHFWVFYAAKCWVAIPPWVYKSISGGRGYYVLESCWITNIGAMLYLTWAFCWGVPERMQLAAMQAFFATAFGFLSWSIITSRNAMVLHSATELTFLFIHTFPSLVFLGLRWRSRLAARADATWAGRFPAEGAMDASSARSVVLAGSALYGFWFTAYSIWLLRSGLDLHRSGVRTGFSVVLRQHREKFERLVGQDDRAHALVYLLAHFCLSIASFAWAALCWRSFSLCVSWLLFANLCMLWQSAGRYVHEVIEDCAGAAGLAASCADSATAAP